MRGSTTVHASFDKVKVRRINSGGGTQVPSGLRGASGIGWPRPDERAGRPRLARVAGANRSLHHGVNRLLRALVTGDSSQAQAAREQAAAALAQAQNIPIDQAREQVAQYEQQYRQTVEQAKQKAAPAADAAAKAASRAALFSVLALALGALAGWFGGRAGAVDPTLTTLALGRQRRA